MGIDKVRKPESEGRLRKSGKAASKAVVGVEKAPSEVRSRRTAASVDSRDAAFAAANAAESKKSHGTLVLDVQKVTVLADYFVIAGGDSVTQVRAIVEAIDAALIQMGLEPKSIEGKKEARWVLMDYEQIIVHVLHEKERSYYKLEQFWNHALIVDRLEWLEDITDGRTGTQPGYTVQKRPRRRT